MPDITLEDLQKVKPWATAADLDVVIKTGITREQLQTVAAVMPPDFMQLVEHYEQKHDCKRSEALSAVARQYPESHAAYIRAHQKRS
jgi:hypothetical protein